jgi:hypothetical protein
LAVVAVAPGAAAPAGGPADEPSRDGSLESLLEDRTVPVAAPRGPARPVPSEARATTINLSGAVTPVSGLGQPRPGAVPLRRIIGARAASGRWPARARRVVKVGGWLTGTATVGAGLLALWVLLFSTISGGDVWLGRPVDKPVRQDQLLQQESVNTPVKPATTSPPAAAKTAAPKATTAPKKAAPSPDRHGGSGSTGATGSTGSGRNGADDPPGDDSGGTRTRTTAPTGGGGSGADSGGSGSGSGGGSGGGSGSGSGSGHGGSDD